MITRETQHGPKGLRYDFNEGCRILAPNNGRPWRIKVFDKDTGNGLYDNQINDGRVSSFKRYFVNFRIEVEQNGGKIFSHDYLAKDKQVLIRIGGGTMGDTIGWFPYAVKFQEKHRCILTCSMHPKFIPLFKDTHKHIEFVAPENVQQNRYYATYDMGLFFDDKEHNRQPCDFRFVGLHRTAGYILGVDPAETPPRVAIPDLPRPIAEPYVCVAVQSTTQSKCWNNPQGWRAIVAFLKSAGYRVVCIDQKPVNGSGLVWTLMPHGVEDQTGDRPLLERVNWLHHADFFIGLSSGLSWLAWAVGRPVVMISGFTHPTNEFTTPYRIINYNVCNSCWNDPHYRFDHADFLWCPRHAGTPRQFECTRLITAEHVRQVIRTIPGFDKSLERASPC